MSYQGAVVAGDPINVLVLSPNPEFAVKIGADLAPGEAQPTSAETLSGDLRSSTGNPNILIVETDPANGEAMTGFAGLRELCGEDTVIIALIPASASMEQARSLRVAGADEVMPLSVTGDELRGQIVRLIRERRPVVPEGIGGGRAPGHVIAVAQARGGVGATTVAVNLACGLVGHSGFLRRKSQKKRVALLDLDLQFGDANVLLDIEDNGGLLDLVETSTVPDGRMMASMMQHHDSGVDILSSPLGFLPLDAARPETIARLISQLQETYDYVVIDMPRAMVEWIEPVLVRASLLLLVTETSVSCIRQAQRIIKFFQEENVGLPVKIVVNREKKPMIKPEHVREAERILEKTFADWLPDNPSTARRASDLGTPVITAFARSDLGKALVKLAASVEATMAIPQTADP